MANIQTLATRLAERFKSQLLSCTTHVGEVTLEVELSAVSEVCFALRTEAEFGFDQLIDLCGVDYLHYGLDEWKTEQASSNGFSRGVTPLQEQRSTLKPARFAVVLHLLSISNNQRLRVRYFAADEAMPLVPSVEPIWNAANWYEREAFDLYGILFSGHTDLRRLLSDYGFVGHPFRKDFPLIGQVEMRYDAQLGRCVYEPVSIEPRVLVPRVIRSNEEPLV